MTPRDKHIVYRENFKPSQPPGLQAYYDLSVPTSIIQGTGVKLLGDLSGNSNVNVFASGGAASNTATIANKSLTGSFTITADVQLSSYTAPASNVTLFDNVTGNSGFRFLLLTTGFLQITVGDGAALTTFSSSAAMTSAVATRHTIQAVYTDNTNVVFNVDGVALGTTVTVNKVLANGAAVTCFTNLNGVVYSLVVGALYSFQPSTAGKFAATLTDSVSGTWTINTSGDLGARICGARDLVQMTGANQPALTAGAVPFITFDGTNDYLKCAAFALSQPTTVYFVGQQITWTINDGFYDGNVLNSMALVQDDLGVTPGLEIFAGTRVRTLSSLAVATNGVLSSVFNGATSSLQLNKTAPITGNVGAANASGFTLGALGSPGGYGNIQVNAVLIYNTAHDAGTIIRITSYLGRRYNIPGAM